MEISKLCFKLGSCDKLGVLSLRENEVAELPLELGKLALLHVLDVSGNRWERGKKAVFLFVCQSFFSLQHLPFTLTALNLHALWLSENQSQPLLKLQTDEDPRTGIKVLTCYLLPQQGCNSAPQGNSCFFVARYPIVQGNPLINVLNSPVINALGSLFCPAPCKKIKTMMIYNNLSIQWLIRLI